MRNIKFAWDSNKNNSNKRKHGVSFEEAQTDFYDDYAQLIADPDHSEEEDHFIILGRSIRLRILVVCHCYREDDEIIRIISARRANKSEQRFYKG
jgi:uncharacterized DUF497 family protein